MMLGDTIYMFGPVLVIKSKRITPEFLFHLRATLENELFE